MRMTTSRIALLLHPVRIRLVRAMGAGGLLTTTDLCARLPDLPKATVYRHVEALLDGGVFEVESERQARGAVERRYRLTLQGARIGPEEAQGMSLEDHRSGFSAAMASLIAEFNVYLDQGGAEPTADGVSYRQFTVWMQPKERDRLTQEFVRLVRPLIENGPGAGREPYLLSSILFPCTSSTAPVKAELQKRHRRTKKR
jgi:DNA-binding transcriptional ArsR family regulator